MPREPLHIRLNVQTVIDLPIRKTAPISCERAIKLYRPAFGHNPFSLAFDAVANNIFFCTDTFVDNRPQLPSGSFERGFET